MASAVEHRTAGALAYETLTGDEGARDAVASAAADLAGRAPYRELADRLADVLAELDDVGSAVRDTAEQIADDPQRLEEVRARRQLLHDLRRKYGDTLADVQRSTATWPRGSTRWSATTSRAAAIGHGAG